jgi:flagellar hook-associated protein 2
LSLTVNKAGAANELLIDTAETRLSFQEITSGRDALLSFGSVGAGGVLISSTSNTFENVVDGLNVTVNSATQKPVTVNVSSSTGSLVSTAKEFVKSYNSLRDALGQATSFDADALTTGILFGTSQALQVDSHISNVLTSRFFGVGQFQSLAAVGISLDDKGKMSLDESKLNAAYNKDPEAVKTFFTDPKLGVSAKLDSVAEQLAGKHSLLSSRVEALKTIIDANSKRIDQISDQLDRQRETLMNQFATLESTVARLKDNLNALSGLQIIPPLTSSSSSSSS